MSSNIVEITLKASRQMGSSQSRSSKKDRSDGSRSTGKAKNSKAHGSSSKGPRPVISFLPKNTKSDTIIKRQEDSDIEAISFLPENGPSSTSFDTNTHIPDIQQEKSHVNKQQHIESTATMDTTNHTQVTEQHSLTSNHAAESKTTASDKDQEINNVVTPSTSAPVNTSNTTTTRCDAGRSTTSNPNKRPRLAPKSPQKSRRPTPPRPRYWREDSISHSPDDRYRSISPPHRRRRDDSYDRYRSRSPSYRYSRSSSPYYRRSRRCTPPSRDCYRPAYDDRSLSPPPPSPLPPPLYLYRSPSPAYYGHRSPSPYYRRRYDSRAPSSYYRRRSLSPPSRLRSRSPSPRGPRKRRESDSGDVYWRPHKRIHSSSGDLQEDTAAATSASNIITNSASLDVSVTQNNTSIVETKTNDGDSILIRTKNTAPNKGSSNTKIILVVDPKLMLLGRRLCPQIVIMI